MARNLVDRLNSKLPETSIYKDSGCGKGCTKSLECPFEQCILDLESSEQIKIERDLMILKSWKEEGSKIEDLASKFKVSRRTIHRVLTKL